MQTISLDDDDDRRRRACLSRCLASSAVWRIPTREPVGQVITAKSEAAPARTVTHSAPNLSPRLFAGVSMTIQSRGGVNEDTNTSVCQVTPGNDWSQNQTMHFCSAHKHSRSICFAQEFGSTNSQLTGMDCSPATARKVRQTLMVAMFTQRSRFSHNAVLEGHTCCLQAVVQRSPATRAVAALDVNSLSILWYDVLGL